MDSGLDPVIERWKKHIFESFRITSRETVETSIVECSSEIKELLLSELSSGQFRSNGVHSLITSCKEILKLTCGNITIHTIGCNQYSVEHKLLAKVIKRCRCICSLYDLQSEVKIWFVPSLQPRKFPRKGDVITSSNINGGFTYVHRALTPSLVMEIFVTRLEEFPKVMIHELIHHTKYNTSNFSVASALRLYSLFKIDTTNCNQQCDTRLEPNEAIVEFWAELHQMAFLSFETGIPFETLLKKEQEYVIRKCKDIMAHQATLPNGVWKEKTHAFSYILIRGILLTNVASFFKLPVPYKESDIVAFIESRQFHHKIPKVKGSSTLRMTALIGDF